jgi:hypothetical protein
LFIGAGQYFSEPDSGNESGVSQQDQTILEHDVDVAGWQDSIVKWPDYRDD